MIVEAFDRADMKLMIIETASEHFPDKFIVAGSGLAGYGNNNDLRTRRLGNLFICGDETSEVIARSCRPWRRAWPWWRRCRPTRCWRSSWTTWSRPAARTSGTSDGENNHEDHFEQ